MINFLHNLALFRVKNAILFGENIFKITTSDPGFHLPFLAATGVPELLQPAPSSGHRPRSEGTRHRMHGPGADLTHLHFARKDLFYLGFILKFHPKNYLCTKLFLKL
jgi:hypothetical protein